MKNLVLVILSVVSAGWRIDFTPHASNVGIQLVTECKGKDGRLGFVAVDYVQVEPTDSSIVTRRQTTPRGEHCTVVASVQRNDEGTTGDPQNDYIGESSIIVEVQ